MGRGMSREYGRKGLLKKDWVEKIIDWNGWREWVVGMGVRNVDVVK